MGARAFIIALLVAWSATAMAEDRQAAKQAFEDGQKYYNLNQYGDALEAFKKAYWNYPEPTFLFNIAQCHRLLKHKSEAVEFYKSYLRNAPDTPRKAEVQRLIADLESAIAKEQTATNAPPLGTAPSTPSPPTAGATSAPATTSSPGGDSGAAATRPELVAQSTPAAEHNDRPVWKRGWFWGVIGGAAAVALGVGLGVGLGTSSTKDPSPSIGSVKVN
jgi:tetratricopeptide (TPR) repeat protein